MHVRKCPDCGEEFRPEIARCSDCGATLVDHWEDEGDGSLELAEPNREAPIPSSLPDRADYRPVASAPSAAEIEPLARQLAQAGIPFAVSGSVHAFLLLVPEGEVERAIGLIAGPEQPSEASAACPACGADARGAAECPECGLVLAADPEGLARARREPIE